MRIEIPESLKKIISANPQIKKAKGIIVDIILIEKLYHGFRVNRAVHLMVIDAHV